MPSPSPQVIEPWVSRGVPSRVRSSRVGSSFTELSVRELLEGLWKVSEDLSRFCASRTMPSPSPEAIGLRVSGRDSPDGKQGVMSEIKVECNKTESEMPYKESTAVQGRLR